MDKNFGLTQDEFNLLVEEVQKGNITYFDQIFLAHFQDCINYLTFNYTAKHEDAYDATMESLLIFHNRMKDGKLSYGNLRFLFTQIASQYYLRWIKKEKVKTGLSDNFDLEESNAQLDPEDLDILGKAWQELSEKCQEMLTSFYYGGVKLNELAMDTGNSHGAIRKQKQRCMDHLRNLFKQFS